MIHKLSTALLVILSNKSSYSLITPTHNPPPITPTYIHSTSPFASKVCKTGGGVFNMMVYTFHVAVSPVAVGIVKADVGGASCARSQGPWAAAVLSTWGSGTRTVPCTVACSSSGE
jgi:hypothetical protein